MNNTPSSPRSPRDLFNYYLLMIAWTILLGIFLPALIAAINGEYQNLIQYLIAFAVIIIIVVVVKKGWPQIIVVVKKEWPQIIKDPFFVTSSSFLLLIYTQLSKNFGVDSYGSSGSDLAICAAIIAAFATIYNVQRTSKQELTKNRQDWITTVRLETAKIISTFDLLKYALLNGAKRDEIISKSKSLLESCNKVRMFMNPSDTIAPIIIAQLDAIVNYCNILLNWQDTSKISIIQSIHQINLHKSLMPWVQVLLKVEWERVKDVLESKEETSDGFYSKDVYEHEWSKGKLEEYGIKVQKNTSDIIKVPKNTSDIINELFPGFKFCDGDEKGIKEKLEKLGIINTN